MSDRLERIRRSWSMDGMYRRNPADEADVRWLLGRVDLLQIVIAQHAANTIMSGRNVHKEDRDLWRAIGQDGVDAALEDA